MMSKNDRFYIHLFAWGEVRHSGGDFVVDREFYEDMKSSFRFLVSGDDRPPQYPPIKRQHKDDGFVYGLICDLFSTDEKDPPVGFTALGIYAEIAPGKALAEWREGGLIGDWSPGFADVWVDPHTGKELKNALRETSFVSDGHLKATEKEHVAYALSADGFVITKLEEGIVEKKKETELQEEMDQISREEFNEVKGSIEALTEAIGRIDARLGELVEEDSEEMESHKEDETDLESKVAELEKKLQAEVALRLETQADAAITASGIEIEEGDRKALLALSAKDVEAFNASLRLLAAKEEKIRELSATPSGPSNPFAFGEVGATGSPSTDGADIERVRELCAEHKQAGKSRHESMRMLAEGGLLNIMDGQDVARKGKVLNKFWG